MIYTIGHKDNYLKSIADYGTIHKLGKRKPGEDDRFPEGYEGGYAFRSIEDAQKRIDEAHAGDGFMVFGVLADWETDTEPALLDWWHNLVNDAEIVVLGESNAAHP